jgi:glycosyltransferase involved in cell wall biosynthesis
MKVPRIGFFTVTPSPYQREFFKAMINSGKMDLTVYYQQMGASDSPWRSYEAGPYEKYLPGWGFDFGRVRVQFNGNFPDLKEADLWIVNASLTSPAAQWFMRHHLRDQPWLYWAERIRPGSTVRGLFQNVMASAIQTAQGIVAIGSSAAKDYRYRFPKHKVWNIPYHCNLEAFQALERKQVIKAEITFLFCGQMIYRKGTDILLNAFARLYANNKKVRLLLVGREGDLSKYLKKLPSEIVSKIEYAGFKEPEELPAFFLRSDIFVLPSRYDGWGVVLNQALAAGLPLICSDQTGAARDLVQAERNGLIVKVGDVEELYHAMNRMAHNPRLIEDWGAFSRKLSQEWTPQAGVQRWQEILSEVL